MRYGLDVDPSRREPGRLRVQLTAGEGGYLIVLDVLSAGDIRAAVEAAVREDLDRRIRGEGVRRPLFNEEPC